MFTHKVYCSKYQKAIVSQLSWPLNKDNQLSKICIAHSFGLKTIKIPKTQTRVDFRHGLWKFTVWPDTATLDTTPALPSPWSYSQIKQFFSLASRTPWTEFLQTGFVHLHAAPPLNQWLGEGCWIWGSTQVQSQHICVSRGTIGGEQNRVLEVRQKRNQASWNLPRECVCVSVCTFVCVCMHELSFCKKNRSMYP